MMRPLAFVAALVVAVGGMVATAGPAIPMAQAEVVFVRMSVDLWPDYDRRGVLVIYRGDLAPSVDLPRTIRLSLPAAAGPPTALAERLPDGQLVNLTFERTVEGDRAYVEAQMTRRTLQLEYYDPRLTVDGATRSFTYRWPAQFEVGELSLTVQQPDLATELSTNPPAAARAPGADGLVYHTVSLGPRVRGEEATVSFRYMKDDERLTVETMQQTMEPPAVVPGEAAAPQQELVVVALVLAVVVVTAAVGFVLVRRRQASSERAPGAVGGRGFCTQCGAKAAAADRFCHRCGRPLRPSGAR